MLSNETRNLFLSELSTRARNAIIQYFRDNSSFNAYSSLAFAAWCETKHLLEIDADILFDQRGVGEATIEEIVDFIGRIKQIRLNPIEPNRSNNAEKNDVFAMSTDVDGHISELEKKDITVEFSLPTEKDKQWLQSVLMRGTFLNSIPTFEINEKMIFIEIDLHIYANEGGESRPTLSAGTFYLAVQEGDTIYNALMYVYEQIPTKMTLCQDFVWVVIDEDYKITKFFSTEPTALKYKETREEVSKEVRYSRSFTGSDKRLYNKEEEQKFIRKEPIKIIK